MATATMVRRKAIGKGRARPADPRRLARAATLFNQLSDQTRLAVVLALAERECNVGELCERTGAAQPAVSHHLRTLRFTGVIEPRREAKFVFYSLTDVGREVAEAARAMVG